LKIAFILTGMIANNNSYSFVILFFIIFLLCYICHVSIVPQVFAAPENVAMNKMDVNNLAMVMAPNCLRSRAMTPQTMLDNARHEMAFVRTLIQYLDTTDMDGIIWIM